MILMATLVLSVFVFVACEDHGHASGETQAETVMEGIPDSIREKIKQQDTVLTACSEKIDRLVQMQNETNKNISDIQKQVNNLKEPSSVWHIIIVISVLLSIASIVIVIVYVKKKKSKETDSKNENIEKDCNTRRTKDDLSERHKSSSRNVSADFPENNSSLKELQRQIQDLQLQVSELKSSCKVTPVATGPGQPIAYHNRFLYVNAVNQLYFIGTTPSLQDDSIFKINLTSQTRGDFDIIDIKKIQQNNQLNNVVEVVHSKCQLAEAKDCKVVEKGSCELLNDGYWKVKKKIQIQIS